MPERPAYPTAIPTCSPEDIRAWLKRLRLNVAQGAERIGVTRRCFNLWLAGQRTPWYLAAVLHYIECQDVEAPR